MIMQMRIAAHATTLCGTVTGVLRLIMIAIMLTDAAQGVVFGKVVSDPPTIYVLEGNNGILRCLNQSENGTVFYNNIGDAQWYRVFPNHTRHQFGNTGPVHVQSHSLHFQPFVRPEDQGVYYCCRPNGSCSENSTVTIAVPPTIEVTKSKYVSTIGSSVTLTCRITNHGSPVANFAWKRNGMWLPYDSVSVNSTHLSLTLSNLTDADAGIYRCAAQGVLTTPIENVNLIIKGVVFGKVVSDPPTIYVLEGNYGILRCQNRSENGTEFYNYIDDAQWYCIFPNDTRHQFGNTGPVHVQSHSLHFQPFVRPEDQGVYYCCKPNGSCSENSTVTISVPPTIEVTKSKYISTIGSSVTLTCRITNHGRPVADFAWKRNGMWLPNDSVSVNSTHFSLTLSNLTDADAGIYRCAAQGVLTTPIENVNLIIREPPEVTISGPTEADFGSNISIECTVLKGNPTPSVFIITPQGRIINESMITFNATIKDAGVYTCLANNSVATVTRNLSLTVYEPPEVTISGPTEVNFGSIVSIGCTVLKGNPTPSVFIITPQGRIINESMITFNATIKDAGVYTCVANNSEATVTRNLSLIVYVAPQPVKSRQWITITAGADVVLPCTVEMANPPPLYHWQHIVPHEDDVVGNFQPLENGSLLLTGVKAPAIYRCMAWNEYGASIQFIYITIDNQQLTNTTLMYLITDPKGNCYHNRSEKFKTAISAALEEYIQEICNCTVVLTNANLICINATSAFYTVQLTNQNSAIPAFIFELLDFIIMNNGIDLGIAIIRTWTTTEEIINDSDDSDKNSTYYWHILSYSLLAMVFTLLILFIPYSCYRYVRNRCTKHYETDRKAAITSQTASTGTTILENELAEQYNKTIQSDQKAVSLGITTTV